MKSMLADARLQATWLVCCHRAHTVDRGREGGNFEVQRDVRQRTQCATLVFDGDALVFILMLQTNTSRRAFCMCCNHGPEIRSIPGHEQSTFRRKEVCDKSKYYTRL